MRPVSGTVEGTYDDGATTPQPRSRSASPMAGPLPLPVPPIGISGPVPSASPGVPVPPPLDDRARSARVGVVFLALGGLLCSTALAAVALVVVGVKQGAPGETPPPSEEGIRPRVAAPAVDSGGAELALLDRRPEPVPVRRDQTREDRAEATTPPPLAEPEPEGPDRGTLTVRKPVDVYATHIEAKCGQAFQQRAKFVDGVATLTGIPDAPCRVSFKGGMVTKQFRARGGNAYTCRKLGSSGLDCR